ncbi:hypothetical protein [Segniliparus rugosus]|uniref:Serine aminopeptidase S33 domain-containing protein n=1 Tax=Segniliparus rugosus (strain ATCC BAA-974 / DSM 45345 / CCUG 50838 / CIP 108380 / JCM 13579 / CDC 945) TaxID=679197 RepID=E5XNP6_SEGRC|nr:hypothetical protein [Segniliparus rugosus]EFV14036.1 hypothetical protein HMPREF9336_01117 [Segniliparus rugosus ATCC BAA-974]
MTKEATRELHTYLGPEEAPLFGAIHLPASGEARGTALVCPPLGKEHFDTVRGLRLLADELASVGIVALRVDYYGTGDSAHEAERDDIIALWDTSVRLGLAHLRALLPLPPAIVALRAGALLVANALASGDAGEVGPVVLWDPVATGRSYLREQRALFAMAADSRATPPEAVPLLGMTLSAEGAAALSGLRIHPAAAGSAARWLIARRPESTGSALDAFARSARPDELVSTGMPEFVQAPGLLVRIPGAAIADIRNWLDRVLPDKAVPVSPTIRDSASFAGPGGEQIVERIERLGEHGLFAIRTFARSPSVDRTALFFATANDTHHGPNRAWVSLSRAVAEMGAQALRFDRRGAGETSRPLAHERTAVYGPSSIEDAFAAARGAGGPDGVITAGVCSGAWHGAAAGRADLAEAVVLVNVTEWSWRHKRALAKADADSSGVLRSDPAFQKSLRGRLKAALRRWLPYPGWLLLGKLGVTQVPEVLLRALADAGVEITAILAPHDADWFDSQRGPEGLRRMRAAPRLLRTGIGDHAAYHPAVRDAVRAVILEWCARNEARCADHAPPPCTEAAND